MDTGVSTDSLGIRTIHQILSPKVVEQYLKASGITKYKYDKKEAYEN